MCRSCKGWGNVYTQAAVITFYGDGDEAERGLVGNIKEQECKDCKGTGYSGGKLRQGTPPILAKDKGEPVITATNSSTIITPLSTEPVPVLDTSLDTELVEGDLRL